MRGQVWTASRSGIKAGVGHRGSIGPIAKSKSFPVPASAWRYLLVAVSSNVKYWWGILGSVASRDFQHFSTHRVSWHSFCFPASQDFSPKYKNFSLYWLGKGRGTGQKMGANHQLYIILYIIYVIFRLSLLWWDAYFISFNLTLLD